MTDLPVSGDTLAHPGLPATGNSPARSPADGALDTASELTQQRLSGNCDTAGIYDPAAARLLLRFAESNYCL